MGDQHKDMYFQSGKIGKSYLTIEWYNQHGCGFKDTEDTNGIDCHTGKTLNLRPHVVLESRLADKIFQFCNINAMQDWIHLVKKCKMVSLLPEVSLLVLLEI